MLIRDTPGLEPSDAGATLDTIRALQERVDEEFADMFDEVIDRLTSERLTARLKSWARR